MLYKKYFGLHETESSTSLATLLLVGGGLVKRGGDRGEACAWNSKQCSSDHITVTWWGGG